ncbi:Zinc finger matrin-type protein 4 [Aix galericulata]|nr:Zinc finger matrin-type protein 4 [Aix galericulata]
MSGTQNVLVAVPSALSLVALGFWLSHALATPGLAPQSQSLLLGVELELQQMIAECLSSTVGLDGCEIWSQGEESCNCNSTSLEQLRYPLCASPTSDAKMKSSDIDQELFTESYCKVCSAQLISESQRVAHYESRKHASKVRLYYMLHPIDGGCPAKKLRSENGSDGDTVDKNKCCTLCNMSFTSAVVAESHYQGKIHAKRLKLLLGEPPALKSAETALSSLKQPHTDRPPVVSSPHQRRDSDRYCQLCAAWFNNPMMAQQHYDGKKHKKNAARADLLEQLGKTLDLGELRGLKRSYTCNICNVTLNSIEQYHAHLKGSKHQTNLKNQ